MSDGPFAHEHAFELLPWLVNGTLAAADREAVERHVRDCIVCRRELKEQRHLQAAVQAQPAVHLSAPMNFGRLTAALDAEQGQGLAPSRRYAPLFRFATVAALGLSLLGLLLWLVPQNASNRLTYTTLATPPAAGGGAEIDVVFGADTTAAEMQRLLDEIGGEIVAGPSEIGRYGIRIGHDDTTADLERALERLTTDPHVRFAGRTFAEQAP